MNTISEMIILAVVAMLASKHALGFPSRNWQKRLLSAPAASTPVSSWQSLRASLRGAFWV